MLRVAGLLLVVLGCGAPEVGSSEPAAREARTSGTFLERRAAFETRLDRRAPLVERWPDDPPPEGAERVVFPSGDLELFGWWSAPDGEGPFATVVFLHGAFFLKRADFEALLPLREAGIAVLAPTLRGRNGNPGDHELLWGEVDDARAAIDWVAARPEVDRDRIHVFGHSLGGATAAMVSLYPDAPVQLTASCGGIYARRTFRYWRGAAPHDRNLVRFDTNDPDEVELRILEPHADQLVHPHLAYLGNTEGTVRRTAEAVQRRAPAGRFEIIEVDGDHMTALHPALEDFLGRIRSDR